MYFHDEKFYGESLDFFDVQEFVSRIFGETQHVKRKESIAQAALGVIAAGASLIVHRIGRGLAKTLNLSDKQADRLLSNKKLVFGMGLHATQIKNPERRDKLFVKKLVWTNI